MVQKIIIDADPGIGDALAIGLALDSPHFDVVGVTATAGVVSGTQAKKNLVAVIEQVDPPRHPRLGDASFEYPPEKPAAGGAWISSRDLHGANGLGEMEGRVLNLHHAHSAHKIMIELVRSFPNEITIVTLGPLTNLAIACDRDPEFSSLVKRVVCLGGASMNTGDVTPAAEFNIFSDPEAARTVMTCPLTLTIVPLEVSNQPGLTMNQFMRFPQHQSEGFAGLISKLVPFYFRTHHQHLGIEGISLQEVTALAAVVHPDWFETERIAVDIETRGELTRGMTVFDFRGTQRWQGNIDVVRSLQGSSVVDFFCHEAVQ